MAVFVEKCPIRYEGTMRCVFLDDQGNRCSRFAKFQDHIHASEELYGGLWVMVFFCEKHFSDINPGDYKFFKKRKGESEGTIL